MRCRRLLVPTSTLLQLRLWRSRTRTSSCMLRVSQRRCAGGTHSLLSMQCAKGMPPPLPPMHPLPASAPPCPPFLPRFELCMPATELRHLLVDDVRAQLFVPDIDVCEWRRRTVQHAAKGQGGGERPQFGWFWSHVEQCSQAEKAEVRSVGSCAARARDVTRDT